MTRLEFYRQFKDQIAISHPLPTENFIGGEYSMRLPQDPFTFEDSFSEGVYQGYLLARQTVSSNND